MCKKVYILKCKIYNEKYEINLIQRGVILKKIIAILLCVLTVAASFAACKSNQNGKVDSTAYLTDAVNEYGFESVEVTDKDGKAVTDKNGEKVTEQVAVVYEKHYYDCN